MLKKEEKGDVCKGCLTRVTEREQDDDKIAKRKYKIQSHIHMEQI